VRKEAPIPRLQVLDRLLRLLPPIIPTARDCPFEGTAITFKLFGLTYSTHPAKGLSRTEHNTHHPRPALGHRPPAPAIWRALP